MDQADLHASWMAEIRSELAAFSPHVATRVTEAITGAGRRYRVWLGGPSDGELRLFREVLCQLLTEIGLEVVVGEKAESGCSPHLIEVDADTCDLIILLAMTPGVSAEAVHFAHLASLKQKLAVFMPIEYRQGFAFRLLASKFLVTSEERLFSLEDLKSSGAALLPRLVFLQVVNWCLDARRRMKSRAMEDRVSEEIRTDWVKDGIEHPCCVGFIDLVGFKLITSSHGHVRAVSKLHEIVAVRKPRAGGEVSILSAATGAIVILPDQTRAVSPHEFLIEILTECRSAGLAVRCGLAHGSLKVLRDSDSHLNMIGEALNIAARLATSEGNHGLLLAESYVQKFGPFDGWNRVFVAGKPHDPPEGFPCYQTTDESSHGLEVSNFGGLGSVRGENASNPGLLLTYDLPEFSGGDCSQLVDRFRTITQTWGDLRKEVTYKWMETSPSMFSPGGDGGTFWIACNEAAGVQLAIRLVDLLRVAALHRARPTDPIPRVSLHYGSVKLYVNADGLERPTGNHLVFAAALIEQKHEGAKIPAGQLVVSEGIGRSATGGSASSFARQYRELSEVTAAGLSMKRYARQEI